VIFAVPCAACALASQYWHLVVARLLVSGIGAGFVVGIRLVGEWFDARQIGLAEGVYGGLGNFGMAAATFGLPLLALVWPGENGWRFAMLVSAALCVAWAFVFYRNVQDAPPGRRFRPARKAGALEVGSAGDLFALSFMQVPMVLCLGVLAWKLVGVGLISATVSYVIYGLLAVLLAQQVRKIWVVNRAVSPLNKSEGKEAPEHRYAFAQVAILCLCYAVTFGGELAVESMLPQYLEKMFGLSVALAGVLGAGFAFASLLARPLGGYLGDRLGRRPIMICSLAGSAVGFFAIMQVGPHWPLWAVMTVVFLAGVFLMAANGANFCIAPLIRKPLTGQIAGLIGAYGNVGSVAFLTILSLATPAVFFGSMTVVAASAFGCCFLLREPVRTPAHEGAVHEEVVSAVPAFA
jgi:NNP family nitrate/nitrite transporter-like MFS transporter